MGPLEFFEALWPEGLEGDSNLLIWTLQDRKSSWFDDFDIAAIYAAKKAESADVYLGVGVGAPPKNNPKQSRLTSSEVKAIPAFYADLDIEGPGHKAKNLFKSRQDAFKFLISLPHQPTISVDTGGGLQCWWLFEEPWYFESDEEHRQAEEMSCGWGRFLRDEGLKAKRHVDAVWDLSRVLRIPGTYNRKLKTPRPVQVISENGPRYNPSDFEDFRVEIKATSRGKGEDLGFTLSADASPHFDKFQTLCSLDTRFTLSWERNRKGLADTTRSGYDMSLASLAADAGWSAQEIADLLVASARRHGDELRLDRPDYYGRTIQKALDDSRARAEAEAKAKSEAEEKAKAKESAKAKAKAVRDAIDLKAELTEEYKDSLCVLIREVTGVPIKKILMHGESPPQFSISFENGSNALIGGSEKLLSWPSWRNIALVHGTIVPHPGRDVWPEFHGAIQQLIEDGTTEDITEKALFLSQIREFVRHAVKFDRGTEAQEFGEHLLTGRPFQKAEHVFLQISSFLEDLRMRRVRITEAECVRLLKYCGFENKRISGFSVTQITRRYWKGSMALLEEH